MLGLNLFMNRAEKLYKQIQDLEYENTFIERYHLVLTRKYHAGTVDYETYQHLMRKLIGPHDYAEVVLVVKVQIEEKKKELAVLINNYETRRAYHKHMGVIAAAVALVVVLFVLSYSFTGLATFISTDYDQIFSLDYNLSNNQTYNFDTNLSLTGLALDAYVMGNGSVKVYLRTAENEFLVMDHNHETDSGSGLSNILGFVALDNYVDNESNVTDVLLENKTEEVPENIIGIDINDLMKIINLSENESVDFNLDVEEFQNGSSRNISFEDILESFNTSLNETVEVDVNETVEPEVNETVEPEVNETVEPEVNETVEPEVNETVGPEVNETVEPEVNETVEPEVNETVEPEVNETVEPEVNETVEPEVNETVEPEVNETVEPEVNETVEPEVNETVEPEVNETVEPEVNETVEPEVNETVEPEVNETIEPEVNETVEPEVNETVEPEVNETVEPEVNETIEPEVNETVEPEVNETVEPEVNETVEPEVNETVEPEVNETVEEIITDGSRYYKAICEESCDFDPQDPPYEIVVVADPGTYVRLTNIRYNYVDILGSLFIDIPKNIYTVDELIGINISNATNYSVDVYSKDVFLGTWETDFILHAEGQYLLSITAFSADVFLTKNFTINVTNITQVPVVYRNLTFNLSREEIVDEEVLSALQYSPRVRVMFRYHDTIAQSKTDTIQSYALASEMNGAQKIANGVKDIFTANEEIVLSSDEKMITDVIDKNLFTADVTQAELESLVESGLIGEIKLDRPVSLFMDKSLPAIGVDVMHDTYGYTGQNTSVCIVDTGINYSLDIFNVTYVSGYDFVNEDSNPYDDHGHGTAMSAIVSTIAPDTEIYVAKVIDENGTGYESDVIRALNYCEGLGVDVISLSIGRGQYEGYCVNDIIARRTDKVVANGTYVIASAGNTGNYTIASPACGMNTTSVGAGMDNGELHGISAFGWGIDIVAPGGLVWTTSMTGNQTLETGTSVSAAHASGASLLLISAGEENVTQLMRDTGTFVPWRGYNYSLINLSRAMEKNYSNIVFGEFGIDWVNQSALPIEVMATCSGNELDIDGVACFSDSGAFAWDGTHDGCAATCASTGFHIYSGASCVFEIDTSGNPNADGSWSWSQSTCTPPSNSFVIYGSGSVVGYIDSSGNVCFEGAGTGTTNILC